MNTKNSIMGCVGCYIYSREGDGPIFVDGHIRLFGYVIMPIEKFNQLVAEKDKLKEF
jgi:hypothetical protein